MRVRVTYTEEVPDWYRRAIRLWHDEPGLATRDEVRDWLRKFGATMDDELAQLHDESMPEPLRVGRGA